MWNIIEIVLLVVFGLVILHTAIRVHIISDTVRIMSETQQIQQFGMTIDEMDAKNK